MSLCWKVNEFLQVFCLETDTMYSLQLEILAKTFSLVFGGLLQEPSSFSTERKEENCPLIVVLVEILSKFLGILSGQ